MLLSASFSEERWVAANGFGLFPGAPSLDAYRSIFKAPAIVLNAYKVSILITVAGTFFGLAINSMTGYVLSRKDFTWRNKFALFFYFVTLINGGLVSTYIIMISWYRLKNTLLVLILPYLVNVFYLIVMRSFIYNIPDSLAESAKIDGAGDFTVYYRIVLPLTKPALATIGLFIALEYWNDWYNAMLYLNKPALYPLQYLLYNMLAAQEAITRISQASGVIVANLPVMTLKMAMAIVATGPILLVYPFVQKYFIRGITVGAVKG
jgi:putative aldouronate transport system permease protein